MEITTGPLEDQLVSVAAVVEDELPSGLGASTVGAPRPLILGLDVMSPREAEWVVRRPSPQCWSVRTQGYEQTWRSLGLRGFPGGVGRTAGGVRPSERHSASVIDRLSAMQANVRGGAGIRQKSDWCSLRPPLRNNRIAITD